MKIFSYQLNTMLQQLHRVKLKLKKKHLFRKLIFLNISGSGPSILKVVRLDGLKSMIKIL